MPKAISKLWVHGARHVSREWRVRVVSFRRIRHQMKCLKRRRFVALYFFCNPSFLKEGILDCIATLDDTASPLITAARGLIWSVDMIDLLLSN